ncbi:MAG: hypothetical protein DWQ10_13310 [Calditrichaeota bacterium]|nr:MAG: hypothetical protein DWQ10_13310 [Calditrichota bacterium]
MRCASADYKELEILNLICTFKTRPFVSAFFCLMFVPAILPAPTQNPAANYWFNQGLNEKNVQLRIHAFTLALKYDPDFVAAQYHLARSFNKERKYQKAEKNYLKAYAKTKVRQVSDTLVVDILQELAEIYKKLAQWKEMEIVLRKAKN